MIATLVPEFERIFGPEPSGGTGGPVRIWSSGSITASSRPFGSTAAPRISCSTRTGRFTPIWSTCTSLTSTRSSRAATTGPTGTARAAGDRVPCTEFESAAAVPSECRRPGSTRGSRPHGRSYEPCSANCRCRTWLLIEDARVDLQARLLCLDRRDRRRQEPAADRPRPGPRRQGVGRRWSAPASREARAAAVFDLSDRSLRADVEEHPRRRPRRRPARSDPPDLRPGPEHRPRQRPARAGGHPATARRAADQHPRPAREPRPARRRPSTTLARRPRGARRHPGPLPRGSTTPTTTLRRRRLALIEAADRRARERDLLAFERDELAAADPQPGEYDELGREAHRLANAEELRIGIGRGVRPALRGRPFRPGDARPGRPPPRPRWPTRSPSWPNRRPTWSGWPRRRARSPVPCDGSARPGRTTPARLEEVETRLALYRRLVGPVPLRPRRAGRPPRAGRTPARRDRARRVRPGRRRCPACRGLARRWPTAAAELSAARRKACKAFAKAVQAQLKDLSLGEARLSVEVETDPARRRPDRRPAPGGRGRSRRDRLHPEPRRAPPPAAQDRLRRRALAGDPGDQDGPGRGRPRADARLRRDRHRRRRPAGLGARQEAGGALAAPPGHLRDPPAADGQLRLPSVGHPQARSSRAEPARRSPRWGNPTASRSSPRCSGATPPPRAPDRRPRPCWPRPGTADEQPWSS